MTFDEVASFYVLTTSHRSKERDQYSLLRLLPFFKGRLIADIRRADVRAYIRQREAQGVTLATIGRELRFASAAVNLARIELEKDFGNPFQSLRLPKGENRVRWLTRDEAERLISAASLHARTPHLPCFIQLAINTGCRANELLGLEWSRVDISRRLVLLEARHTKTAKRRTIPLNDAAISALDELRLWQHNNYPGNPWVFPSRCDGHIRDLTIGFQASCKRAGITDFTVHDLRHTCASWLVMAGADLYAVRDLLGHSSVTVTEKYAHLSPRQLVAAVQLLGNLQHKASDDELNNDLGRPSPTSPDVYRPKL